MAMQAAICSKPCSGPPGQPIHVARASRFLGPARCCLGSSAGLKSEPLRCNTQGAGWRKSGSKVWRVSCSLSPEVKESVDKFLADNKVVVFMKGTKLFPQCGFSNTVVQILNSLNANYETVNILEDNGLRQAMKEYSNWPTFPQLYIDGEFFGGCDIAIEAYQSGELKELLEKVSVS